jgi:hypothetical protein
MVTGCRIQGKAQKTKVVGQFESVLKGRGSGRAVNASKSIAALAAAGMCFFKLTH